MENFFSISNFIFLNIKYFHLLLENLSSDAVSFAHLNANDLEMTL